MTIQRTTVTAVQTSVLHFMHISLSQNATMRHITLVAGLPSQNLPELLGCVAVGIDTLLYGVNISGSASKVMLGLDECGQLRSL